MNREVRPPREVRVAELRNLIDGVFQASASLASCLADEVPREARWVRNTLADLDGVVCTRASGRDRVRAEEARRRAEEVLSRRSADDHRPGYTGGPFGPFASPS